MKQLLTLLFFIFCCSISNTVSAALDCSINSSVSTPPPSGNNVCLSAPDTTDYTIIYADPWVIGAEEHLSGNFYAMGKVTLLPGKNKNHTEIDGNLYAVGDIYMNNHTTITGWAYTQNGVIYHNQGDQNIVIDGGTCECGVPLPAIFLPVEELSEQCSAIFKDAAQSHSSSGKLTMWGNSQIIDATTKFDFAAYEQWGNSDGCGDNVQCAITEEQSAELSSFIIPSIQGSDITVASWGDGLDITLGDPDSTTEKYKGTVFGSVEVFSGGNISFLAQQYPEQQLYLINRLTIHGGGVVKMAGGVYAVNNLNVNEANAQIEVVGDGKVYIFVQNANGIQANITGKTGQIVLVFNSDIQFNGNATFSGSIYSAGNLILDNNTAIDGRVASQNLTMTSGAKISNSLVCGTSPSEDYLLNITTSSDALTCEPHSVQIQVTDAEGNAVTDYAGKITLSSSSNKGIWSSTTAKGTLTEDGVDDGVATYQFASDDGGVVEMGLFNDTATDLTVTVSGDDADSVQSPAISFRAYQLKAQLSPFTTANLPFALKLTAVGKDQTTGSCQVIKEYTGAQQLKFWSSYLNPSSPAGLNVEVNQTAIADNAAAAVAQSVTFADGVATVAVNYPDAGQIEIHARDDAGIGAPPTDSEKGDELQGSAITVVNPLQLSIRQITGTKRAAGVVTGNITNNGTQATGGGFIRASVPNYGSLDVDTFAVTVQAIKDCSNDPNNHCTGIYGKKTPSFVNNITLEPSLLFPTSASAALGTVHSENGLTLEMRGGEVSYSDLAYDEVGTLGLTASSDDYLVSANTVGAADLKAVGRFYPDYLAYGNYNYSAGCGSSDFTYMMAEGSTAPVSQSAVSVNYVLQANAQAAAGAAPKVTTNYDFNSGYPVAQNADFKYFAYAQDLTDLSSRVFPDSYYAQENWNSGIYSVTALSMGLQKSSSVDGPFLSSMPDGSPDADNHIDYYIRLTGFDGEKLQLNSATPCSSDKCLLEDPNTSSSLGDFAYGRLQAGNGHGSEYQPIRAAIQATYYDGSDFVAFPRDNCTTVVAAQVAKETAAGSENDITAAANLSISNSPLISGKTYFDFAAPDNRGKLNYYIDLHNAAPWLLDSGNEVECKDASAGVNDCIKGFVEFGLFRGKDRIIYRLQTFD